MEEPPPPRILSVVGLAGGGAATQFLEVSLQEGRWPLSWSRGTLCEVFEGEK